MEKDEKIVLALVIVFVTFLGIKGLQETFSQPSATPTTQAELPQTKVNQDDAVTLQKEVQTNGINLYDAAEDSYVDDYAEATLDNKWGFVVKDGHFVVPPVYAGVQNLEGDYFLVCKADTEHCAYMNKKTKKLLTGFKYLSGNGTVDASFFDGMAAFSIQDKGVIKIGYLDNKGREVIPAKYTEGTPFKKGRAIVREETNGSYFVIDKTGNKIGTASPEEFYSY